MTNDQKKEFTLRITQAGEAGLIVVVYEIILEYLAEAIKSYNDADRKSFRRNVHLAQDAIRVQQKSLQKEYDLSNALFKLYIFFHAHLAKAVTKNSVQELSEVAHMIEQLLKAYQEIQSTIEEVPLMENTQKVYAGLTYGRHSLVENMDQSGENRGYLV